MFTSFPSNFAPHPRFLLRFMALYFLSVIVTLRKSCEQCMLRSLNVTHVYSRLTFQDWIPKREHVLKTGSSFSAAVSYPWFGEMPVQTMLQFHSTTIMAKIHKNKLTMNIGEVAGKGTLHYLQVELQIPWPLQKLGWSRFKLKMDSHMTQQLHSSTHTQGFILLHKLCTLCSVNYRLQEFTLFYLLQFYFLSTFVILLIVLNTGVLASLFHLNTSWVHWRRSLT